MLPTDVILRNKLETVIDVYRRKGAGDKLLEKFLRRRVREKFISSQTSKEIVGTRETKVGEGCGAVPSIFSRKQMSKVAEDHQGKMCSFPECRWMS